jgi:hypothetical protein
MWRLNDFDNDVTLDLDGNIMEGLIWNARTLKCLKSKINK